MPMPCSICTHGDRVKIDRELGRKRSLETLSRKFEVSISSLKRHTKNHNGVPPAPIRSAPAVADDFEAAFEKWRQRHKMDSPESVLKFASLQLYRLELLVDDAQANGDNKTAIAGIAATLKTTQDLFAKYVGLISDAPRIDQSTKVFAVLADFSVDDLRKIQSQLAVHKPALPSGDV